MIPSNSIVLGIITNKEDKLLIAKRPLKKYLEGFWEFPGGKIEKNENAYEALIREVKEETGLVVTQAKSILKFNYQYKDRLLHFETWNVLDYQGEPIGLEGQQIKWVKRSSLKNYNFPPANVELINKLTEKAFY